MRKIALLSVYDKTGLESVANTFKSMGYELLSTGGSRKYLLDKGFDVLEVSDFTGEPERFGGRVKTLHHKVLGGVLFRPGQDEAEWPFDFRIAAVVCNFYPFEDKAASCEDLEQLMEWVDIGGPNMVRAAAKNHQHVLVLTDPSQYSRLVTAQALGEEGLNRRLSLEALVKIAQLDQLIASELRHRIMGDGPAQEGLRYGENPHQKAWFIPNAKANIRHYGDLSFNNIRDAEAALKFVAPFHGPAVAVVKHQTLCGASVSQQQTDKEAVFNFAWEGDVVSRFGGVIALNFAPTQEIVAELEKRFIEVLLMPRSAETEAIADALSSKKEKLKIVLVNSEMMGKHASHEEVFQGALGELHQETDRLEHAGDDAVLSEFFKSFGQWTAACSKSNAITMVGLSKEEGIAFLAGAGQGQPNRVDALRLLAIPRAQDYCTRMKESFSELSCFSDAFLPFRDTLDILKEAGVKRLFQPGGSKKDAELKQVAEELEIDMVITRERHFWH